ncbi:DUF58 domain-containing protein [Herbiconiux sp. P15]|uniref:DUF58 domain-containing protein n=1 Tax=Herbiconiux liukaitaii TaxID=3342799 RepID=UPI0035BB8B5F
MSSVARPTARGWGLIVAAILVFALTQVVRRQELAYLACFLLAVPLFALAWVAFRRLSISVTRRFEPESGVVDQRITAGLYLQNWGRVRTPSGVWIEHAEAPLRSSRPLVLPSLPGYASSTLDAPELHRVQYPLDTRFRGAHSIGPFGVTLTDPFGCAMRRMVFGGSDVVLVTPAVFELARIDLRLASGDGAEQLSRRLYGAGEQDVIARKYLAGDSIRRVHWPATAKHGELMVRQDDQRNDQDAVILLDSASFAEESSSVGSGGAPSSAGVRTGSRRSRRRDAPDAGFEWAVSAVASIALHLMNEGFGVRMIGAGRGSTGGSPTGRSGSSSSRVAGSNSGPAPDTDESTVHTAPFGSRSVVQALAWSRPGAHLDPVEFRLAVEEAALTSPDAPPVFAVVSGASGSATRIRDLAAMSSHAVAFVVGDRRDPAVAADLRRAGWTVVESGPDDSLTSLWKALGDARGIG